MKIIMILLVAFAACTPKDEACTDCMGVVGPMGPVGIQGIQGPTGPAGQQGNQGLQGTIGPQGIQGNTGPQGIQGPTGPAGASGQMGPAGAAGVAGPQGMQGLQGPAGQQGIQGPAGNPGASMRILSASDGQEIGFPIPWRTRSMGSDVALFAHQENPSDDFPQGWIIPVDPVDFIHYTGSNCSGSPLIKSDTSYNNIRYSNFLWWVPNHTVLYKKNLTQVGGISSSKRHSGTGSCTTGDGAGSYINISDSGFRMQVLNTLPWEVVFQ